MKLKELAKLVSGKVVGNGTLQIKRVSPLDEAALRSRASALVVGRKSKISLKAGIMVDNPRLALAKILPLFEPKKLIHKGIHKTAVVPKSCKLGKNVSVGAYVVLGEKVSVGDRCAILPHTHIGEETKIGKDCFLHSHVSIYARVRIGNRVILHSGTRIGVDGYGYVQENGKHLKIPQVGRVIIEDDVEVYANVCISRGTLEDTVVGSGTKIDNLSHIAHNCKIGKNCAIVSLVGFAGSVTLGDNVYVAGQAGFGGHLTVGENSIIMGKSGVTKDVPANSVISGFPAQDHRKEMEFRASLRRLAKKAK